MKSNFLRSYALNPQPLLALHELVGGYAEPDECVIFGTPANDNCSTEEEAESLEWENYIASIPGGLL